MDVIKLYNVQEKQKTRNHHQILLIKMLKINLYKTNTNKLLFQ